MPLPAFQSVLEYAQTQLGFHQMAQLVVPIVGFQTHGEHLQTWLKNQFNAEMDWMANYLDKRLHPETLMEGTQSILCFTFNYNPGAINQKAKTKIARYAVGDDYHKVLKNKLKQLLKWLQTFDEALEGRALVDSAPILEKALAQKAGLGWQGKHSCLITKDIGSWVFIGELLLNKPLPEAPVPVELPNYCGSCTRCITACPTDAIVEPTVIDANKCISYWTIEYKGNSFPKEIEDNLNGWLFGCDICQDVCPWNIKFEQPTPETAFLARAINQNPSPKAILELKEADFKTAYQNSPLKRPKLKGLQRNAKALKSNPVKKQQS